MSLARCRPLSPGPSPHRMGRGEILICTGYPGWRSPDLTPGYFLAALPGRSDSPAEGGRVRGSHAYKEMRERITKQAEGKTTLLGVGWCFPHCRWTAPCGGPPKAKSPESSAALRAHQPQPNLPATMAATVLAVATVGAAIISVARVPLVPGSHVNHPRRAVSHWRRVIAYRRRAVSDGWRTISNRWRVVRRWRRVVSHRWRIDGHREGDAHRPTRLGGSGEPGNGNHGDQTEKCFCFHARFDGSYPECFSRLKGRDLFWCEAVREKKGKNE